LQILNLALFLALKLSAIPLTLLFARRVRMLGRIIGMGFGLMVTYVVFSLAGRYVSLSLCLSLSLSVSFDHSINAPPIPFPLDALLYVVRWPISVLLGVPAETDTARTVISLLVAAVAIAVIPNPISRTSLGRTVCVAAALLAPVAGLLCVPNHILKNSVRKNECGN
jgi:hypothetical protein